MNFFVDLRNLGVKGPRGSARPGEGLTPRRSQRLDFDEALALGRFQDVHDRLTAISQDGTVDWARFDITEFGSYMPSLATFDRIATPEGEADYLYGFAGENLNRVAKRSLRGLKLRDVLTGPSRDGILAEYAQTLSEGRPSASTGMVDISDLFWLRYLRFLYPVRRGGETNRLLCFMLFASRAAGDSRGFAKSAI